MSVPFGLNALTFSDIWTSLCEQLSKVFPICEPEKI